VEITNEVRLLLPIMTSIMVAKWVADNATHSLYHAQIEQKCIPFLDFNLNTQMSMELFTAHDVAKSPVIILEEIHNVHELAKILISCPHNAFPVVHHAQNPKERSDLLSRPLHGLVQASVLRQLLSREELYRTSDAMNDHHSRGEIPLLRFEDISDFEARFMNQNESDQTDTLNHLANDEAGVHANKFIDLAPYINTSATAVQQTYSLDRTYILFRSLGLRHLVVVDQHNRPTGIITRKDLMGFKIEEKLEAVIEKVKSGESASSGAAATPKHDDGVEMQDTSGSGQQHLNPAYDADA